jgi:hypothetical protein
VTLLKSWILRLSQECSCHEQTFLHKKAGEEPVQMLIAGGVSISLIKKAAVRVIPRSRGRFT